MTAMKWRTAKLVDVAAKKRWAMNGGPFGSKLSTKHYSDSGVPVIRGTNISGSSKFSFDDFVFVSEEKADELRANNAHPGDLIFTQRGTIGQVGLIPLNSQIPRFVISQSQMKLTSDPAQADALFLYYVFSAAETVQKIQNLAFAAGVPHINLDILRKFEVPLPPVPIQRRIAGILSAYDELMENCQRRIRILEEMARALHREWFVHFRFPGHETVSRVDSPVGPIPSGWEVRAVPTCVDISPRVTIPSDGEKPFVPMGCLSNYSMLITDIETRAGNSGAKFQNGDTLFARITPCLENGKTGFVQFLPDANAVAFGSTEFIVMRSRTLTPEFVYLLARSDEFRGNAIKSMSGATGRQRVQEKCFDGFLIAHPPRDLLDRFSAIVAPSFRLIHQIHLKTENLRRTRDLLLPRLLSGQVSLDVSAVEDVAEPTAPAPPLSQTDLASEEPALRAAEEAPPYRVERAGRSVFRAKGAASYQPGATPQEPPAPTASAESATHSAPPMPADESPLQGSRRFLSNPGALPQAGDEAAPLALQTAGDDHAPLARHGHGDAPVQRPADEAPVPIGQIDRTAVLQVIRQVFSEGPPRERDAAIRDVARALGYRRTGARIHEILHTDLLTAVRRGILENTGGALRLLARSITDYERDFLKQQFLAAIGRPWIDRDTAIRDFCRWLGFARTGPVIEDTARSVINGLLREGRLEADGAELIRRV